MDTLLSIGEAAKRLGKCVRTLQRWDETGVLVALRTPSGHRAYSIEMLRKAMGLSDDQARPEALQ